MRRQNRRAAEQLFQSGEEVQMRKSFLNEVLEAFAMFDSVAYMHYIECKQEGARQAAVTPPGDSVQRYRDQCVAFSERMGFWHDNEEPSSTTTSERRQS